MSEVSAQVMAVCGAITATQQRFRQISHRWKLACPDDHSDYLSQLSALRRELCATINQVEVETAKTLVFRKDGPLRLSGMLRSVLAQDPGEPDEQTRLQEATEALAENIDSATALRALMIFSLYRQPSELRAIPAFERLPTRLLHPWILFLLDYPNLRLPNEEALYLEHQERVLDGLLSMARNTRNDDLSRKSALIRAVHDSFSYQAAFFTDLPIGPVLQKRGRLIERIGGWLAGEDFQDWKPEPRMHGRKVRIGILTRNLLNYTDTWAFFYHFHKFDPTRYDLYFYSIEIADPHVSHDLAFYRELWNLPTKAVVLPDDFRERLRIIRADDLDCFVLATAYGGLEMLVSQRLARIQVALNSMLPSSTGLRAFDFLTTGRLDKSQMSNYQNETTEQVVEYDGPLLWYRRPTPRALVENVTREALGISEDTSVFYNFHSLQKIVPSTLRHWLTILDRVPESVLVLSPYNPAWGDPSFAPIFETRLRFALQAFPNVTRDRIIVTGMLSPAESETIMRLSDVFLGSFPHGGGTSVMLSLANGVPCVVRKSPWPRGASDANMMIESGLPELVGRDSEEYVEIAVELGLNRDKRLKIKEKMKAMGPASPVFDVDGGSKNLQRVFDQITQDLVQPSPKETAQAG